MSIELAVAWACRTLRIQQAADDAAHMFEQAARDDKRATILVSGQLSKDGKGWLARWTGSEVVVAELTQRQQAGLGLKPGAMSQHLERAVDSSARGCRCTSGRRRPRRSGRCLAPGGRARHLCAVASPA